MKRTQAIALALTLLFVSFPFGASASPGNGHGTGQPQAERIREATAKYNSLIRAVADGYVNINVFVSGQGFHYLNQGLLDGTFDADHPELLVYSPTPEGTLHLVAVEYAVPLSLSPEAPEGFPGTDDVWERNETFGIWTLHAWAWEDNPAGFFADTNPLVP